MNRKVKVKICGVCSTEIASAAARLGADYVGIVFAEGSPRRVVEDVAKEIAACVARLGNSTRTVGVFTSPCVEEIARRAAKIGLDVVQLHRIATWDEVAYLRSAGFEVWTLAGGATADAVLFDSSHGDGETVLRKGDFLSVLAGGISTENLVEVMASGADVIDLSGSLECRPGIKTVEKIEEFFMKLKEIEDVENAQ